MLGGVHRMLHSKEVAEAMHSIALYRLMAKNTNNPLSHSDFLKKHTKTKNLCLF